MRLSRTTIFVLASLCACVETSAQHLEVKGVRKKSKASDCATIVFKSDFDDLKVISMSSDSIYKKKGCDYNNVWTQYVDLRYEREHAADTLINRSFVLHTPYTKDLELTVPGKDKQLSQAIYEYKVRMIDYFPLRVACEVDVVRLRDYFGLRMSAGRRWGGYLSFKFSVQKREGFNADEIGKDVDVSKKTYLGRIRNSYMAGIKYLEEECKKANSGTIADWFHTVIYCFDAKKSRLDSFEKEHILDELMKNGVRLIFAMTKWGLCSEKEKNAAQETLKKYYPDLSAVPIESVSQKLRNQTTTVQLGRDDLFCEMCINLRENLIFNLLNITRQKVNSAVNKSKRDVEEYYDEQAGFFTAYGSDLQNKIISYAADSYERNVSAAYQTLSDTYEQINLMSRSVISSYTGLNLDPEGLFIRKLVSEEAYKITGWDNSFSEYFYTLLSFTNIPLLIIRRLWIKRSYGEKISEKLDEANGSIQGSLDKYFERILYTEEQFRETFLMKYRTKRNRT